MQRASAVLSSVVWPAHFTFFHIISSTVRFSEKKRLLNIKCVFRFSPQLLCETFFIPRNERDVIKNVYRFESEVPCRYSSPLLMTLEFSRKILEKNNQISNYYENPSSDSRVVPCGRTDGRAGGIK
jgi:hypothetical protein